MFGLRIPLIFAVIVLLSGCGRFFAQKPTELETAKILSELSKIKVLPDESPKIPEIYKKPPQIIVKKDRAHLFYFAKHHLVDEIATHTTRQFKDYPVSQVVATNQLIIRCPSEEEAKNVLEFLEKLDVPPIQIKVDCIISEVYADITMDWETNILIENLFGEDIMFEGGLPGAALREVGRSKIGLKVGYWRNRGVSGDQFKSLIDLLVSRGYMKILMNPSLEVVNGKTAKILSSEHMPLPKEVVSPQFQPYQTTEYKDVIDSLEVTPYVFADGYIGLETKAVIGSKQTPEGVKQIPILTLREIQNKENRIRQGESLIIGGMKKIERRSVIRGIPFLKDIPVLGILFSSKDFEERAKEIIFIITPTISSSGKTRSEMIKEIEEKHQRPLESKMMDE